MRFFSTSSWSLLVCSMPIQPSSAAAHSGPANAHMIAAFMTFGGSQPMRASEGSSCLLWSPKPQ